MDSCRRFSFAEIQSATNNFDDSLVIGTGGFGKVYKGSMNNGATTVAIKRLKTDSKQGEEEFWNEVNMLSKLRHTNIVSLIGHCRDCQEMILVYEYISRGNLADHLYCTRPEKETISHLTWEQRLIICIDAACGLDFLHTGTNQSFIHRDVKTTNILLDEKWVAKISDFGLSKGTRSHSTTHVSTSVKGTFGYLDPDYFYTRRLTQKSDVYGFGVVLLEVLCGRPALDTRLELDDHEEVSLVIWAQSIVKKRKLDQIVDPSLSGQISPHCLKYFVEVANSCLRISPKERPSMGFVKESLELILALQCKGGTNRISKFFQGITLVSPLGVNRSKREPPSSLADISRLYRNFSLVEIQAATKDFNKDFVIGRGKSSTVYKGFVDGGSLVVAIKRLNQTKLINHYRRVLAEAKVQSLILSQLHMVSLIGVCFEINNDSKNGNQEFILVYDYMVNWSLQDHLYSTKNQYQFGWKKRLKICIDVAQGLQFLHTNAKHQVIHTNIKSSKILLDENWAAKISDFTRAEMGSTKITSADDVYSFGVILLEVLCPVKPVNPLPTESRMLLLVRMFKTSVQKGTTIDQVIDPYLIGKIAPECLKEFVKIAWRCLVEIPRPSIDDVVRSLQSAFQLQMGWEKRILTRAELPPNSYNNVLSNDSTEFILENNKSFLV